MCPIKLIYGGIIMKKKLLSITLALALATSCFTTASAKDKNNVMSPSEQTKVTEKLVKNSSGKLKIYKHENKGLQFMMSGKLSEKKTPGGDAAIAYLEENKAVLGLSGSDKSFKVTYEGKDDLGFTYVKLNQLIKGRPVRGKDLIVHFNKDGVITSVNGVIENKAVDLGAQTLTAISEKKAIDIAKSQFNYKELRAEPKVENQAVVIEDKFYEIYSVNIQYNEPEIGNWDVLVDVNSGKVLDRISNIREDGAVTGSGLAVDGTTKPLNLYLSAGSYTMQDTTKSMTGQIKTYTANNAQVEPGTLVSNTSSTFNSESFKAPVSAHYFAGVVYDFYKNLFSRNSIDNKGMNIISTTHYGSKYNNAFWDGSQMVYGDGDGTTFTYLSGDLDVVAHELTHGVTSYTANLNYSYQSGALNESMSDVFGVLVQTYDKYGIKNGSTWTFNSADWVVGDDVYTPGKSGDALRSLANPKLYNQPDNMSGYVNTTADNGGVHTNSGIPNKAAYLVAQSIGCEKTAKIYYRALTTYLTASSDFLAARNALVQSATDLYGAGSAEVNAIGSAFDSVGVVQFNDPYEPNDTLAQAYSASSGVTYNSYIASSTDLDYYKISATSGKSISISLTNLPKDYDLYLYDSNGNKVAYSYKGGTTSESITYTAKYTGTYYILVKGYNGAYSTSTKYALKATF